VTGVREGCDLPARASVGKQVVLPDEADRGHASHDG
jgi:hypothetical protein